MKDLEHTIIGLWNEIGLAGTELPMLRLLIVLMVFAVLAYLLFRIMKRYVVGVIYSVFKRTSFQWDDEFADRKSLNSVAHLGPAFLFKLMVPLIFRDFDILLSFADQFANGYLMIIGMMVVISFLKTVESILSHSEIFLEKPISSYFQIVRILIYIVTGILVLSELLGKSPIYFLSAFGAMTAIILLIFKDTIMGLVASVQISSNGMVKVGDWVEMPKFNADGDVIAINLYTIKIRNWDKTITTVPTYFFITDSFKNWRGMQESGGRRVKRSIYINAHSIRFVDPQTRERYKHYNLIRDFIVKRQQEIEEYNQANQIDTSELINGRRMTNIGVFRNYAMAYLENHPYVRQDMALLVRQLAMEDRGLPIEIYCFTTTTKWADYEDIQANIFDHLLAAAGFFDLEIHQQPGGSDIKRAVEQLAKIKSLV